MLVWYYPIRSGVDPSFNCRINVQSSRCGVGNGDHQVPVTKGIALGRTAILAHDFADVARGLGLSDHDLAEA